jgi:ankyrin repeat protein
VCACCVYDIYIYITLSLSLSFSDTHTHTHTHKHTHAHTHTHTHTQEYGRTALHWAAGYGHGGIAEALLQAGCNKDILDKV